MDDNAPGSRAKPYRLCRAPGCTRRRLCFAGGPRGTMGCSHSCMHIISDFGYFPPTPSHMEPGEITSWILDELSLNAAEKDGLAQTFVEIMSDQFIGCPLAHGTVPRNPSPYDLELLTALELAGHPRPPQGFPPHHSCRTASKESASPQSFIFAFSTLNQA